MDLDAVRTFVTIADEGQFQHAAASLFITQQAVSKRIAALEAELGVRLFTRTAKAAVLTVDGQAFLPHARSVLDAVHRATESVQPGRRALRVDVLRRHIAPAGLLQDFHRSHPDIELDVVTLPNANAATEAVHNGTIDAAFCNLLTPPPSSVRSIRVHDEPIELLTSPAHHFASAQNVTLAELRGHRIWMPGIVAGTEWAAFYDELAATFDLAIDATGPNFGVEHLLDTLSGSPSLATFVGEQTRLAHNLLRRIPLHSPIPLYPHSLIWRPDNNHPALATLVDHLTHRPHPQHDTTTWTPSWAR